MDKIDPSMSEAEFAVLVRHSGLPANEAQRAVLYEVFGHFEAMCAIVRTAGGGERDRGAEPSHIFLPTQGWDLP